MKKDIYIPTPTGLHLAIIPKEDQIWDLYLINKNEHSLQNILVVTEAQGENTVSSKLRYFLESIPPLSYIKFETVYGDVAHLENFITTTYYVGLDIYEKLFSFRASALEDKRIIPFIELEGYLMD